MIHSLDGASIARVRSYLYVCGLPVDIKKQEL